METTKSDQYIAGWNYRCTYVKFGKYKLPRNVPKNYDYINGFNECNTAYNIATTEGIISAKSPEYPSKL
jgi:hypothetical protein